MVDAFGLHLLDLIMLVNNFISSVQSAWMDWKAISFM